MRTAIYQPFTSLRRWQDEMDRAFGGTPVGANAPTADIHWIPAVDIHAEADRYVITADVPGVEPSAIEVTLADGVLTIRGERRVEQPEEGAATARRVERVTGSFLRRFALPDTADAERVAARSVNGVLEVTIPKKTEVQPKKIPVAA